MTPNCVCKSPKNIVCKYLEDEKENVIGACNVSEIKVACISLKYIHVVIYSENNVHCKNAATQSGIVYEAALQDGRR